VTVDPRRAGLAADADHWLRVRPGTDAALAIAITSVMLERGYYDADFARRWPNAPLLVRADSGRLLRSGAHCLAWDAVAGEPVTYDPDTRSYDVEESRLALDGRYTVGGVECRPVLAALAEHYREHAAAEVTGVPATEIEQVAETLWTSRPVAFYTWSGLEQHSGTTQTIRAINVLYALLGCLDAPGGNVRFTPVPTNPIRSASASNGVATGRTTSAKSAVGVRKRSATTAKSSRASASRPRALSPWAITRLAPKLTRARARPSSAAL